MIKKLRTDAEMSRQQFCKVFGIPYRTLQNWELGEREVPEYVIKLIEMSLIKMGKVKVDNMWRVEYKWSGETEWSEYIYFDTEIEARADIDAEYKEDAKLQYHLWCGDEFIE